MKISTAIIGLGKIGLTYDLDEFGVAIPNQVMTHCRSVSESNFFKISYLIDSQIEPVQVAVHQYGGAGFQSVVEAQGQDAPQLVIVSVPTSFHLKTLLEITEKWNPAAYLIEKPFGSSSNEARQMRDILELRDAKVYVNYLRRYLPNFISLRSSPLFHNRGRLKSVVINGYGTLENIFSHFLDLLIYIESSSILGLSKKSIYSSDNENLKFKDTVTGVLFELNGIGQGIRECEMTLVYNSVIIEMTSNGRCLEIRTTQGNTIDIFNVSKNAFDSYQAIVLKRIADEFTLSERNTSVTDAIRIHGFIESI